MPHPEVCRPIQGPHIQLFKPSARFARPAHARLLYFFRFLCYSVFEVIIMRIKRFFCIIAAILICIASASAYNGDLRVFVTYDSGNPGEYHFSDCWKVHKTRNPMSLENALSKGFHPCPWCEPPESLSKEVSLPAWSYNERFVGWDDWESYCAFEDEVGPLYDIRDQYDSAEIQLIQEAHANTIGAKLGLPAPTWAWISVAVVLSIVLDVTVISVVLHIKSRRAWQDEFH